MKFKIPEIKGAIEAILFGAGEAVSMDKICEFLEIDKNTLMKIVVNMEYEYNNEERGIVIKIVGNKLQLASKEKYHNFLKALLEPRATKQLSQAALEVLAIIAYNQPVTRAEIDKIRGVNSDSSLNSLIERELVCVSGKKDVLGKPKLYKTTDEFLRAFGIKNLDNLPELDENIDKTFFEAIEDE